MAQASDSGQVTKAYGFNPQAAQRGLWSTDTIWQADVNAGNLTNASSQHHHGVCPSDRCR